MEVKPGYKQTEVGAIPEDWEVKSAGELAAAKIIDKPLDGNHGNIHPKSSDYVGYGIPFVMANNISGGRVDYDTCKFITKERADKLQKGFSIQGDVLLTHKGTVGKTAIVGSLATDYIMLTPQVTYYRVLDPNQLNNNFLRHYFDSGPFQSLFLNLSGGGTRAYLGIVRQLALPVVLPPISEQRAIAGALGDVDALLDALEQLIAKKRDLKQATMQQLLTGQKRLPGFSGEWEAKRLGDVAHINMGQSPDSRYYNRAGQGLPLVQGNADIENRRSILRVWTTQVTKSCDKQDLLLTVRAPVGAVGRASLPSCIGRGVCSLKPNGVNQQFLFHALVFAEPSWKILEQGSTFTAANSAQVAAFSLLFAPSVQEQTAIAEVLSDMDTEIAALEERLAKTRALKQGMMQELLTGRVRLV